GSSARGARPGAGVGLGLPASAADGGRRGEGEGGLRRGDDRVHHARQARARDEPPARLLRPARGHQDGASWALVRHLLLRVEGTGELLRRGVRGADRGAGRLVLPFAHELLSGPQGLRGLLPVQDGRLLGRGGEGRGAGGGLLRRLDHPQHSRTLQGRPRHLGLV
ncbi:MAG: hypothetical protein AVDCRST_MAG05-4551, partial [uncultured Rubrobacteraceae bacterium]